MSRSSWRDVASPIIAKVLRDTAGKPEREIRGALFDAYPFGPREYHPYKIWLDEIQWQRKAKASVDWTTPLFGATDDPENGGGNG